MLVRRPVCRFGRRSSIRLRSPNSGSLAMLGFTLVLASLKVWLEHGIKRDLMYDKFPDEAYADR